jgi:arylsulfatase A-like enzyme
LKLLNLEIEYYPWHVTRKTIPMKYLTIIATALMIGLPLLHMQCSAKKEQISKPNIILVIADDLGWADVGYNGHRYFETPNLDLLATEGIVMNRFYASAANCAPSRACILTGMFTPRHGVYIPQGYARGGETAAMRWKVPTEDEDSSFLTIPVSINNVDHSFESLAELLKTAGYMSGRFGKWHIGDDNQGFDYSTANGDDGFITNKNGKEARFYSDTVVAEKLTDAAIRFMNENKSQPFFIYLSHWEVHTPMAAAPTRVAYFKEKAEAMGLENYNAVYAAEVEALDVSLGRIMTELKRLGLEENTLLIYTSDNGGLMSQTTNAPLRAGKGSYYEGGIRVPFVARWPNMIPAGSSTDEATIGVDFMPTFAEISGAARPANQPVDGTSMLPIFKNPGYKMDRQIFFHFPLYLGGEEVLPVYGTDLLYWKAVPSTVIMEGAWKLIYYHEYESYELFNLADDISESADLRGNQPELEEKLLQNLWSWIDETNAPVSKVENTAFSLEGL